MILKPRKKLTYHFNVGADWDYGAIFEGGICVCATERIAWMKGKRLPWCLKEAKKKGYTWTRQSRCLKVDVYHASEEQFSRKRSL